jgi:nitroreductase
MSRNDAFNHAAPETLDLLLTRRSGSAKAMDGPGPSQQQLAQILKAGARAPDHGKLFPWCFIAEAARNDGERDKQIEEERARFLRAPVVIGVISSARELHKIPVWEQELSAGAVCQNILIAATALGFVGNWLTEWYAYHPAVKQGLGLKAGERIAGFIYLGTAKDPLEERPRPDMDKITSWF